MKLAKRLIGLIILFISFLMCSTLFISSVNFNNAIAEESSAVNGETETSAMAGDVNGDEAVNNKDLTRLIQYLADWDVVVNRVALDINGDGETNNKDLTRFIQYLADWDVEIYVTELLEVNFEANGGTLVSGDILQKVFPGDDAVAPTFERSGYNFIGFDKDYTNITEKTTITAQWEEIHIHEFKEQDTDSKYLKSNATCTQKAVYYYSCECGECGEETFEFGDAENHVIKDNACVKCMQQINNEDLKFVELSSTKIDGLDRPALYINTKDNSLVYKNVEYTDFDMPVISLEGDIYLATKDNKVKVEFSYYGEKDFQESGTVKVQGSSSSSYPKKNYTLSLDSKLKIVSEWGKQKKYCLKANYVDFSQARNIVSAELYGQIVKDREIEDEVSELINGGAIDGFPVIIFSNGEFLGLYTFNIPKDKWLFGMKDSDEKNQAILMGDSWQDAVSFKETVNEEFSNGLELEFYSNEESEVDNSSEWVRQSINNLINFVNNNDGEDFINGIENYVSIERCIDVLIYTYVICGADNTAKNILWVTYDGVKWQPSVYDMDGTWGMIWDGSFEYNPETEMILNYEPSQRLFKKIYQYYYNDIVDRYNELRQSILSFENIKKVFTEFFNSIPTEIYEQEKNKWTNVPSQDVNNYEQIIAWAEKHLEKMDSVLKKK